MSPTASSWLACQISMRHITHTLHGTPPPATRTSPSRYTDSDCQYFMSVRSQPCFHPSMLSPSPNCNISCNVKILLSNSMADVSLVEPKLFHSSKLCQSHFERSPFWRILQDGWKEKAILWRRNLQLKQGLILCGILFWFKSNLPLNRHWKGSGC